MRIKDIIAGFVAKGNTFRVPVDLIVNRQSQSVSGVRVTAQVPQGITLTGIVGQGVFVAPNVWDVGTVMPMNTVHGDFEFTYDDDTINDFEIVFTLFAAGCQSCFAETEMTVRLHISSCGDCNQLNDMEAHDNSPGALLEKRVGIDWKYMGQTSPVWETYIHLTEAQTQTLAASHAGQGPPLIIEGFTKPADKIVVLDYEFIMIHNTPANGVEMSRIWPFYGYEFFYDYAGTHAPGNPQGVQPGQEDELMIKLQGGAPAPNWVDEAILHLKYIKANSIHP